MNWLQHQIRHIDPTLGVVTSYAGLVTARAFLGLVEGPMFPGIVLYLSGFYTREELSLRSGYLLLAHQKFIYHSITGLHFSSLQRLSQVLFRDCLPPESRTWMV